MPALRVGAKPPAFSWAVTMLDLVERILREIRTLRESTEGLVLNGSDRKSTRLNSSHVSESRMPSSA